MILVVLIVVGLVLLCGYISFQSTELAPAEYDDYCSIDWDA